MQQRFSVSHNGQEVGPYTKDEIIQKLKVDELFPTDYVYVEAQADWIALIEFAPDAFAVEASKADKTNTSAKQSTDVVVDAKTLPEISLKAPESVAVAKEEKAPKVIPPVPNKVTAAGTKVEPKAEAPAIQAQKTEAQKGDSKKSEVKLDQVTLDGGVGTIELLQYTAGEVQLELKSEKLKSDGAEKFVVSAAPAASLKLAGPEQLTAGDSCRIEFEAVDKWGNCDTNFSGKVSVSLSEGAEVKGGEVNLKQGRGYFEFVSKKAEKIAASMGKFGNLDTSAIWSVVYQAGPAVRLIVESPTEVVAGQPVKVQVRAVDEFGNLATTCNESVKLAVNAPAKSSAA